MKTARTLLGVNVDHIATLRQARGSRYPDPVQAALDAEQAGADGITVHLREDRRHIQDRDVYMLKDTLVTRMNLEMAVTDEMIAIAKDICPAFCCLVPEKREELTTEGGLNVLVSEETIKDACQQLGEKGIIVSLFIDPDEEQINAARRCGAGAIEIHTGHYADAPSSDAQKNELVNIQRAAAYGAEEGLIVNAGHGLHYHNVEAIASIPSVYELNIGHSIIAQSLFTGLKSAVKDMRDLIRDASCYE